MSYHISYLIIGVDQMLQLRFQGLGIGYFETLMPSDPSHSFMHATTPTEPPTQPAHSANSSPSPSPGFSASEESPVWMSPPVVFEVGQVVRHKRFGYRCVINGWDQRPLQVTNTPSY